MVSDDVVDAACLLRSRPAAIVASADEAKVVQLVKFSCWSSKRFKRNDSVRSVSLRWHAGGARLGLQVGL